MADALQVICLHCNATNRIPRARLEEGGVCGNCKQPLSVAYPFDLTKANFDRHVRATDVPLVVDFWASWCGPCRMMAPGFAEAAVKLAPRVRLAKLDTDAESEIAGRYGIRSIPTLIAFSGGREVARQAGALRFPELIDWINGHVPQI